VSTTYVLPLADSRATLDRVGGKGASLARLMQAGLPVPDGFHVTTAAYRQFVDENDLQARIVQALELANVTSPATLDAASRAIAGLFDRAAIPPAIADAVAQAYAGLMGQGPAVAVRSSATAEDLPEASFAGQQETYLNVRGASAVLEAVVKCWASLWTARAIGYRVRQGIDQDAVSLAVVVQLLVPAEAAGIMFTANPINGQRGQIAINASWGLGESIVGGSVTPDTLIIDKVSGQVIERGIADKQAMTVRTSEGTEEKPVPQTLRRAPVLSDGQAAELAHLGAQIEGHYGIPMDIEWAIVDGVFSILQARPITALPEPEAEPPTEWTVPDPKGVYYRASIVELLPDPLTPLFATLGGRAISAGSLQLFTEIVGPGVMPDEMFVTINEYGYYHMRMTLKFLWRILVRIWPFMPEFFRGEERWRDEARPRYLAVIERWRNRPLHEYAAAGLLDGVSQIVAEAVNVYTVFQSGVIGLAMGAELLFTQFYERLVRRRGDPPALTFLLGGDSAPIQAEKSLYDVAQWCGEHPGLAGYVAHVPSDRLAAQLEHDLPPADVDIDDWREWRLRFQAHLAEHGHAIYDLDFAKPVPADDPGPLLGMLKLYLNAQGANPHERQREQIARREEAAQAISERLRGLRLKWFRKLLEWAQEYVPMREDTLADVGLGYPLLRQMLRELGARLVRAGMLEQADDVYWLHEAEAVGAAAALDRGEAPDRMPEAIHRRRAVWRAAKRVTPPPGLPERSGMAGLLEKLGPTRATQAEGDTIVGVGASPGCVTVQACVLRGPEDFDRMQPGGALVAAITTPAWTPLFAMAAAVVTDVGGPLSHGSIVAREYGIPAVLGTGVATVRIENGQVITVDGTAGTVTLS
jgi:pyruvate,water dikinase